MEYHFERNIAEIKQEYTTFLVNIITPMIYEGVKSVYSFALNANKEFIERGKHDPNIKSPGILKIFQLSLKEIPTLNNNSIEMETTRIKANSKCADWFDDLVKAVVKSNIILLSFSNPKKRAAIIKEQYHDKIEVKDFIHKCYIESARLIYNNPELFWHEFPPLEIKRNQREACELIKQAITEAIRKMLPIKLILKEYLQNDYLEDDDDIANKINDSQYMNIKSMVQRDLNGNIKKKSFPTDSVLETESTDDSENKKIDINNESDDIEDTEEDLIDNSSSSNKNSNEVEDYLQKEGGEEGEDEFLKNIQNSLKSMENQPVESSNDNHDTQSNIYDKNANEANIFEKNESNNKEEKEFNNIIENNKNRVNNEQIETKQNYEFDEIQNLLKKDNKESVYNDEDFNINKKKLDKKEMQLYNEVERELKPKEPDRKLFFEQYMK